jgi:hypothetical protein
VLALLCAAFAALGYFQGPKLTAGQVDGDLAVTRSGQQLRLFANQQLADVDAADVTITPAVDFTVSTSAAIVAVQFGAPLLYNATYTVELAGVRNASGGQPSTLRYEFSTGSPPVYYLDRAETADQPDEIVRTGVRGAERTVVYSATGIQDFALIGDRSAAVSTTAPDGTSALSLVSFDDGGVEPLTLPAAGTIENLRAADDGVTVGFQFSAADGSGSGILTTLNLDAGRTFVPLAGLDGSPLAVTDWFFVPGGVSLVAHTADERVLLVDTATGITTPLGTFTSLESLSTDGTRLGVTNPFGPVALTIADLEETEFAASPVEGVTPFPGEFQLMRDGLVQHVVTVSYETSDFTNMLVYDDGTVSRELYRTVDDRGSIGDFEVTGNDQYVAIEVVPAVETAVSDGAPVDPRATSITTIIVDISTGAVVKTVAGFGLEW